MDYLPLQNVYNDIHCIIGLKVVCSIQLFDILKRLHYIFVPLMQFAGLTLEGAYS